MHLWEWLIERIRPNDLFVQAAQNIHSEYNRFPLVSAVYKARHFIEKGAMSSSE